MDITLERILSLIPRKPDGSYVHGALKEFAESIGLKSGNLISDWQAGRSTSYKKKLHEIAVKYDVSVEWLKGETDIKKTTTLSDGGDIDESLISRLVQLTPEELRQVDAFVQGLLASRSV